MKMSQSKPTCKLTGGTGNVFVMMSKARKTLKDKGMSDEAEEMVRRVKAEAKGQNQALDIISEYVEII